MPLLEPRPSWVSIVDASVKVHLRHSPATDREKRACLRSDIVAGLKEKITFPHRTSFRGLVVRQRTLQTRERVEHWQVPKAAALECIEVVPERFQREAYNAIGGVVLWRQAESLQGGSVVDVECSLLDPGWYRLAPPGLIADLHKLNVTVGVRC